MRLFQLVIVLMKIIFPKPDNDDYPTNFKQKFFFHISQIYLAYLSFPESTNRSQNEDVSSEYICQ